MKIRIALPLIIAGFGLFLGFASTGTRVVNAEGAQTFLRPMFVDEQQPGKPVILQAKLIDADGNALGGNKVEFYVETNTFGPRDMKIGEALTESTGIASVSYLPSTVGAQQAVVRFAGNKQLAAAQATFQFTAVGPARVHQDAEFGLKSIRDAAPVGVFVLVAAVWIVLAVVVVSVVRGVRAGATEHEFQPAGLAEASSLGREAGRD